MSLTIHHPNSCAMKKAFVVFPCRPHNFVFWSDTKTFLDGRRS